MTVRHVLEGALGAVAVLVTWLSAIGAARSKRAYVRVHFLGPAGTVGAIALALAVAFGDGDVWFKLKTGLAVAISLVLTPVVAHAFARAEYDRGEDAT